jgi:hypothetical protein
MERRVKLTGTIFAASAALCLAGASAAMAEPTFDAFRQVCLDTGGDFPAAKAAASAAAWKPVQVMSPAFNGVTVSDTTSLGRPIGNGDATLVVWRGKNANNVQVSECTMQVSSGNFASVQQAVQGWAGFDPQETAAGKATFRFTDADGAHKAVAPADYDAAASGSGMSILRVSAANNGINLDLLKIKK